MTVAELHELVRRTHSYAELSRELLENVLDMLDGRYPSQEFGELRARIVWDRLAGTIRARKGARQLAVANAGTIPDRGLYLVTLPDGRRVGELDEEMVYEARAGQTFLLGASSWRIEEIGRDRVVVTPAPGVPGAVPFWKGDSVGREKELGAAIGAFSRWAVEQDAGTLEREYGLDERAARNLLEYLNEQLAATRVLPSERTIVLERFRDEIGDWRLCVLSPFGGRVHSAWALAISAKMHERFGVEADAIAADDGIVLHLPDLDADDTESLPSAAELLLIDPEEVEQSVTGEVGGSALFGARFRENASRALLIPRAYPGRRTPAVAAASEGPEPARGGAPLQRLPDRARDLPGVPAGRARRPRPAGAAARPALARGLAGRGRDPHRLAVRVLAAVRLRRHLHVRGRHAHRRAPGGRAVAGPRPAAGAARPGGAARTDRPGRPAARRGRPPAPLGDDAGDRQRRAPRRAATGRGPRRGRGPGARVRGRRRGRAARPAGGGAARDPPAPGRPRALYRRRRGGAVPRRARGGAARGAAGGVRGAGRGRADAAGGPLRAHPRTLHERRAARALRRGPGSGAAGARARGDARAGRAAPRRQRAGVVRRGGPAAPAPGVAGGPAQGDRARRRAPSGRLPARLAGDRPSRPGGRRRRPPARGAGAAAGSGAAGRELGARRAAAPHRRLLAVAGWTSCARAASWCGSGRARSGRSGRVALYFREDAPAIGAPAAGRLGATARGSRARAACARACGRGRASSATCWSRSTAPPRRCARRCGTSCGPAR